MANLQPKIKCRQTPGVSQNSPDTLQICHLLLRKVTLVLGKQALNANPTGTRIEPVTTMLFRKGNPQAAATIFMEQTTDRATSVSDHHRTPHKVHLSGLCLCRHSAK